MRGLAFAALLFAGCFNPDEPSCSFACGSAGECPNDYACQSDGYCHKNGDNTACGFSDAAMPDIAEPVDLSVGDAGDAGTHDLSSTDGNPPPDMTQVD